MRTQAARRTFTVDPGAVSHYVRQLILEDEWRESIRFLTQETTPRLDFPNAIDLLTGKLDIQTQGDQFVLVEQDPAEPKYQRFVNNLAYMKSGILSRDGMFYRPYGVITGFHRKDEKEVLDAFAVTEMAMTRDQYRQARAHVYAKHIPGSIVCFIDGQDPIIFKQVSDPPFWLQTFNDAGEALADFKEKCRRDLEEFGESHQVVKSDTLEFYIKAVVHDALRRGGDYELPDEDEFLLQELITARMDLDYEIEEVEQGEPRYEKAYLVTKELLLDKFHNLAYREMYRRRIVAQAEKVGGFIDLVAEYPDGPRTVVVPAAPFLHWARRNSEKELKQGAVPDWKVVCPESFKTQNDSSMHSDWWIGAGLTVDDYEQEKHPVDVAAWLYVMRFARDRDQQCVKLGGSGRVSGTVVFPGPNEGVPAGSIAVVPSAGPAYELALLSACKGGAGAVIAEVGGRLAHLAIVSRELGARLVVMENATKVLKPGQLVTLDLDKCIIETTCGEVS